MVIPVKNEARNLPAVLASLPEWVHEVVVVDGHSVDDTVAVATACRPDVTVVTQPGRGKGDALRAGFRACTGDIVVMMDGDGSTPGSEIVRFVSALVGGADYAKGSRFANSGDSDDITPARRLGNRVLSGLVNVIFGTRYTDLCYGYNAFWARHLETLDLECSGFEIETIMNIRAAKADISVQEVPSHEHERMHGESNLRVLGDGWRILKAIAAEARHRDSRPGAPAGRRGRSPASGAGHTWDGDVLGQEIGTERPGKVSVVICAHTEDRWAETCAAIASVEAQSFPDPEIIVVVDHNAGLHAKLARAFPHATVVENTGAPGLSGAKNTGIGVAGGDVVAFLDDDAVADPDWLKFLVDAYAHPDVIGVGGLTLPDWRVPCPAWFPVEFNWVVGCNYRGMPESRTPVRNLLGGNSSFRREAFALALFRPGIGRDAGKRPMGCEETEFCIRLRQRSPRSVLLIEERATIAHLVPAERGSFGYFVRRCYAEGLSKARVTASVGARDGLEAERRHVTGALPRGVARGLREWAGGDASGLARAGAIVTGLHATVAGYAVGSAGRTARRIRRTGPPPSAPEPAGGDGVG
ncbi:MAG TPA: glycosyltransferase [Acidimicrobiales bacterium]|nr:glycosyltransferase [Acidimicrobiales bacterium]